ncbi:MAG: EAL domain-containing protein [Gammaproteobacteria bacterium]
MTPQIKTTPSDFRELGCSQCLHGESLGFDFSMAFQPIVYLKNKRVFAQEALARGLAGEPAGTVFEQVNEDNLYRFDQTCRVKTIELVSRLGLSSLVSINFMPRAVYRPELCIRTTLAAAKEYSLNSSQIMFEVTEGEQVDDNSHLKSIIDYYKSKGFKTAIDDFGAGFSGLNLLAEFQPDYVKLDMALIRGIDSSKPRKAIIKGVVTMCHELNIGIIAEGIENTSERDCLLDLGIYLQQGFLFAKPAFQKLIREEDISEFI